MLLYFLVVILCSIQYCTTVESDFTVELEAGRRECFHQYVAKDSGFEIEYQVIEGGDLDINFIVQAPSGKVVMTEVRKTDGIHKIDTTEDGDYMFCLDNTFSRFSKKLVFFEIVTDEEDPNWTQNVNFDGLEQQEELLDMKLEDFRGVLEKIKQHLDKSQQTQNILRVFESRDRAIQEDNFTRVNHWSGAQLFVMITVGLVQVLLIRSLFEDRSNVGKVLKMKT